MIVPGTGINETESSISSRDVDDFPGDKATLSFYMITVFRVERQS